MTIFLLYFESKNGNSRNYSGFAKVGKFEIPKSIFSGYIDLVFMGGKYVGGMISEGADLGAGAFFSKNKDRDFLVLELKNFLSARLLNDSVVCNLAKFIYNGQDVVRFISNPIDIKMSEFDNFFNVDYFQNKQLLRITR